MNCKFKTPSTKGNKTLPYCEKAGTGMKSIVKKDFWMTENALSHEYYAIRYGKRKQKKITRVEDSGNRPN